MTRHHHHTTTPTRPHVRRAVAGLAIAAGASFAGVVASNDAGAAPRTKSTVIAAEAESAVAALDRWTESGQPADYVLFVQQRNRAATMTEGEIALPAGSLRDEWAGAPVEKQEAVLAAVSQLGVPYESLASEPGVGFDCSGLTIWAFGEAGVEIPRISRDQIDDAEAIDATDAEAGDLVYYPGHISIYLGADMMVHSPNSGSHVEITDLPEKSLRFGDAAAAQESAVDELGSLMDRALTVAE